MSRLSDEWTTSRAHQERVNQVAEAFKGVDPNTEDGEAPDANRWWNN